MSTNDARRRAEEALTDVLVTSGERSMFWCPGCGCAHFVDPVRGERRPRA